MRFDTREVPSPLPHVFLAVMIVVGIAGMGAFVPLLDCKYCTDGVLDPVSYDPEKGPCPNCHGRGTESLALRRFRNEFNPEYYVKLSEELMRRSYSYP